MTIIERFRTLWGGRQKPPTIKKRSTPHSSEDLTDDEIEWMRHSCRTHGGEVWCPDCQETPLLAGPRGPGMVNVKCPACNHYFNISDYFMAVPMGHRNPRPHHDD